MSQVKFAAIAAGSLIAVAMLIPVPCGARISGRVNTSQNNLKTIAKAIDRYAREFGHYPPAYVADKQGKPLYSWRVLLLPYLDKKELYDRFDKFKAWDSPENLAVSNSDIVAFRSPLERSDDHCTDYVAVVGKQTLFVAPPDKLVAYDYQGDTSKTIAIVEIARSKIHWAEPVDLQFDTMSMKINDPAGNSISSSLSASVGVGFADGHAERLLPADAPDKVRDLLTRKRGEPATAITK